MQRDMKIGMALGVALVGIVGALFFRREPESSADKTPPPLPKAEQLDREIAEQAKAPYIQGLEEFDAPSAPVPPPTGTAKPNAGAKADKPLETSGAKPAATPEPLRPTKAAPATVDSAPAHNRDWEPTGPSAAPGRKPGDAPRASPAGSITGTGRTHVIRPGDTLSGLAARYLGSSGRFREIYDANRDQLRSADDVREGMTLKIPDAGKSRDAQPVAETPESGRAVAGPSGNKPAPKARTVSRKVEDEEEVENPPARSSEPAVEAPREKLRFVPVPRGPFSAGRVRQPESN